MSSFADQAQNPSRTEAEASLGLSGKVKFVAEIKEVLIQLKNAGTRLYEFSNSDSVQFARVSEFEGKIVEQTQASRPDPINPQSTLVCTSVTLERDDKRESFLVPQAIILDQTDDYSVKVRRMVTLSLNRTFGEGAEQNFCEQLLSDLKALLNLENPGLLVEFGRNGKSRVEIIPFQDRLENSNRAWRRLLDKVEALSQGDIAA